MKRRVRRKKQKGGFAAAAIVPALIALAKSAGLGAVSAAAGYGVKRGLEKTEKRKTKRRKKGGALGSILVGAAKAGYALGKDKGYKRMGAKGVTGHYRRHPRPWER